MKYQVIININSFVYDIEADNEENAKNLAILKYEDEENGVPLDINYCEVEELKKED